MAGEDTGYTDVHWRYIVGVVSAVHEYSSSTIGHAKQREELLDRELARLLASIPDIRKTQTSAR